MRIRTPRLLLRPMELADAAPIAVLAGDYDVASMTGMIPHPYSQVQAVEWIERAGKGDEGVVFALLRSSRLVGCAGYMPLDADHAELGYWLGKPFWGAGLATEAVRAVVAHAFDAHGFAYLTAGHFTDNETSKRVLEKLGFERDGEELRECTARGQSVSCLTYRLDRVTAVSALRFG